MSNQFRVKRIALAKFLPVILVISSITLVPIQAANSHGLIDETNIAASQGTVDASLFVATKLASTAVAHTTAATTSGHTDARSTSLYYKDSTSGTAQTATVLTGGLLSLYAMISTTTAISATGGGIMYGSAAASIVSRGETSTGTAFTVLEANKGTATAIAIIFQAPSTAGEVTISMRSGGTTPATTPSSTRLLRGTEVASIVVTVQGSTTLNSTHTAANSTTNRAVVSGTVNASMITATTTNSGGSAVAPSAAAAIEGTSISSAARSSGLLAKDSTMGTAQTATLLTGGKLALYSLVSTTSAFTASAGTFSGTTQASGAITYSDPARTTLATLTSAQSALGATAVGTLWTAPSTAGTYTVSMYYTSNTSVPTLAAPGNGVLGANITVTVVTASAGGSFSAAYSSCATKDDTTAISQTAANADSTTAQMANGSPWYIGFILRDSYAAYLADGNIVVSATNGAIVNVDEDGDGSALASGTGSTVVQYGNGNAGQVKIVQGTAGAPVTTTVTISYNGTTVCTKTVKIVGAASSVEISDVATVDLGGNTAIPGWLDEGSLVTGGQRNGHYRILLKDSAGNIVNPATADSFSMDPATTTTTVTALTVNSNYATSTSSSSGARFSVGTFTCGPVAGSSAVKLRHTTAATGVTITSPAFTARCADDPYTYTASWDKAAYTAGEIATLTVKFLDSKGNAANSVDTPGPVTMVTPFLTAVSSTGSASMLPNAAGVKTYTFTVGAEDGSLTAGSYVSIVDFTNLTAVAAEKQTPSYKLSTGSSDVTFTEVLKSVVALIASINKQIQALQKLILRR